MYVNFFDDQVEEKWECLEVTITVKEGNIFVKKEGNFLIFEIIL